MKNNYLKCLALLAILIGGNIFSMPRPSSQAQSEMQKAAAKSARDSLKAKAASEKQKSGPVREKLEEAFMTDKEWRRKKYPDRCYIYQEGTDNGVGIKKDFLIKNSELVRNIIEQNKGVMPEEIGLPFRYSAILLMFQILTEPNEIKLSSSSKEWNEIIKVARYLQISPEMMDLIFQSEPSGYYSLPWYRKIFWYLSGKK